jgi:hypothetical protein
MPPAHGDEEGDCGGSATSGSGSQGLQLIFCYQIEARVKNRKSFFKQMFGHFFGEQPYPEARGGDPSQAKMAIGGSTG